MIILPASEFSISDLTDAYNRTRTDYLIPMPMNPHRMQEYIDLYDVNLSCSRVAVVEGSIAGLGMLGMRTGLGWITRLGVLPEGRRKGVATKILETLVDESNRNDRPVIWLEVIKNNLPAHKIFLKFNFKETRELIVARRPPITVKNVATVSNAREIHHLQHDEVIELHCRRRERMNWLNAVETMQNMRRLTETVADVVDGRPRLQSPHLTGILVEFQNGAQGWASFHASRFQLKRISVEVIHGDPVDTTSHLLECMHHLYSSQDAVIENIPDDERWMGYQKAGYFEVFRRIEMVKDSRENNI